MVKTKETLPAEIAYRDLAAALIAGHLEAGVRDEFDSQWWHAPDRIAERAFAIADALDKRRGTK